jgi:TPR repeat protein
LEWLREKSLSRLSEPDDSSGRWKYILIAVMLVAAGFGTLQWVANRPATSNAHPVAATAPAQTAEQPETPVQPPAPVTPQPTEKTAESEAAATKPARVGPSAPAIDTTGATRPNANAEAPTPSRILPQGGTEELNLAQGYLQGKHGTRDPAEAAKWLWKAVAKQNATADVLLADLYITGDGVPKSCAQGRLLLSAAAQKGEPNAAEKLRQLESTGCR